MKTHNGLSVESIVKCIDPGKELGLILAEKYVVLKIIDLWTVIVQHNLIEKPSIPVMSGRFEILKGNNE